jgi:hypothetical protein
MTIDGHRKSSSVSHREMSDEEFNREIAKMKAYLSVLMEMLQESEEDQIFGWMLRKKKVKWNMLQVKLKHGLRARLRKEPKAVECEMLFCICEPENGSVLGEDEDKYVDEIPDESLMNYLESSYQHETMMSEASNEAIGSYVFNTDDFCMVAGHKSDEDGQPSTVFIKEVRGFPYEGNQSKDYTHLVNEFVEAELQEYVGAANRTKLACGDSHAKDQGDEEQYSDAMLISFDEEMKLLEEMFQLSNEIEIFLIEHVFTGIEYGGVGKEAATVKKADQQDQRQLQDAKLSKGDKYRDKRQETHQVPEECRAKK